MVVLRSTFVGESSMLFFFAFVFLGPLLVPIFPRLRLLGFVLWWLFCLSLVRFGGPV